MATKKQKKFVRNIYINVRNKKKKRLGKIAKKSGYSDTSSEKPGRIIKSKGVRNLADKLGLTEQFLLTCLKDDIQAKKKDRARELDMGFKIQGSYAPEKYEQVLPFKYNIKKGEPTKRED